MNRFLVLAAATVVAGAPLYSQHGPGQHGQKPHSADGAADAGAMFKERCAGCHIPPDLRFKPDNAWLDQIKQTA